MKILLVRNDNIGDLINTTPAIEALRKTYPTAQIDIVVNSLNHCAIAGNPFVNHIYCYTKSKHKKGLKTKLKVLLEKWRLLKQIKKEGYDLAILFRYDFSPSSIQWIKAANAPMSLGVKNLKGQDAFTHPTAPDSKLHEVLLCFSQLKPVNIDYQNEPTRFVVPEDMKKPYEKYQGSIGFHCSSRMPENKYPFEKFEEIIRAFPDDKIILTAEPADFEKAQALANRTHAEFVKTKSFQDCAALLSHCKLILTLDGGVAHVGPALGVRTITLLGKNNIDRWCPWNSRDWTLENAERDCSKHEAETVIQLIKQSL